ncbi:MAG TPA: secretin N-terminal domain-containing protein [Thermoanaerobaculia bacterium]|nr:secretin N-terminal domain-containing protein [Thermoanaerobaculia bacterium]
MKLRNLGAATILGLLLLSSCTSYRSYQKAQEHEILGEWDQAVMAYNRALDLDPDNIRYKMALQRARLEASREHFDKGKSLRAAGHNPLAAIEFQLAVELDPSNQFAAVELSKAVEAVRMQQTAGRENTIEEMKRAATQKSRPPALNPASNEPISLSFPKDTNVKDIYRALGNAFGINVMFDQRVKDDKITIELRDVTAQQALERVMQAAGHFYKVLDEKTIIVVPDSAQTRREYEDLVIRTFYLSNGDAEQVTNVVRTMIEARNVFPLKALNAITIRDTADKVLIAEKIIEANDKARAEVVVQVELLQMDATRARDIGLSIGGLAPGSVNLIDGAGAALTRGTLETIRGLSDESFSFSLPTATYNLLKTSTDAQLLARPQLRISEGEKATLHIGQKVPVPVTTFTSTAPGQGQVYAPATTFNYQDVGIKISIEPRVHHNREVTLKLVVEVSNIAGEVTSPNGPSQPIIGTRTIESTIRLQDGETNFLAGLIRKDDNVSETDTPFFSDLPILGRLFTRDKRDTNSTDLVLTMTPHIIRIPDITDADLAPMWVGTSSNMTFRGASPRIESQNNGDPFVAPPPADEQFRHQTPSPWSAAPQDQTMEEQPKPEPILEEPPPPPAGMPTDPFQDDNRVRQQSAVDPAPRIAPRPDLLQVASGGSAAWTVTGSDLEGVAVPQLVFRYSPYAIDIADVLVGAAVISDPAAPALASVDRIAGTITLRATDGGPLRFRSDGEILSLVVSGSVPGESFLIIEHGMAVDGRGRMISASVEGGRVRVMEVQ